MTLDHIQQISRLNLIEKYGLPKFDFLNYAKTIANCAQIPESGVWVAIKC